jgi:hypothetical protein
VIGNAVRVMRIATGEEEEETATMKGKEYARKGVLKGDFRSGALLVG